MNRIEDQAFSAGSALRIRFVRLVDGVSLCMKRFVGFARQYGDYAVLRALVEGTGKGMGKNAVKVKEKEKNKGKNKGKVKPAAVLERELLKVNKRFYPAVAGVTVAEMYSLLGRVRGAGAGAKKNAFTGSAYTSEQLRAVMGLTGKDGEMLPTVMLLGRCNAGKSSLVNALVGSEVARVKRYAGLTPCLNVYTVAEKFCVVDTPGYGVKGAPWQGALVMEAVAALKADGALRKVFVVADAARGAQVSEYDLAVYDMLAGEGVYGGGLCTVLNKCDLPTGAVATVVGDSGGGGGDSGSSVGGSSVDSVGTGVVSRNTTTTTTSSTTTGVAATASAYAVQSGSPVLCVSASLGAVGALLWAVADAVGVHKGSLVVSRTERVVEGRERAKREIAVRRADRRSRVGSGKEF